MRRVSTCAVNDLNSQHAKNKLLIRLHHTQTLLDISCCQVALFATQTTELLQNVDSLFFETNDFHKTPSQMKKKDTFFAGEPKVLRRVQSIKTRLMREHAVQIAKINKDLKF